MSKLIDADALHDLVECAMRNLRTAKLSRPVIHAIVENAPTVDAVEVVRCKDCANGHYDCDGDVYCNKHEFTADADFFCAYGEKKSDDWIKVERRVNDNSN